MPTEGFNEKALQFLGLQTDLIVERLGGNNLKTIPSVQEMQELLSTISGTVTAIATELADCCEELKALGKEILTQLTRNFRSLFRALIAFRKNAKNYLDKK